MENVMFNGSVLLAHKESDREVYVPIKPICQAIGIDHRNQRNVISKRHVLSSVVVLKTYKGSDGKEYEMFCLPLEYLNGWLLNIDIRKVKPEARDPLVKYQKECYRVLYEHFFGERRLAGGIDDREAIVAANRHIEMAARKAAALIRWELRMLMDRRGCDIEELVQLAREAVTIRETYSGFSPVVWDRYPAPAETCRRMAKRMNTMVMSEWESRRQAEEDEAWRQE